MDMTGFVVAIDGPGGSGKTSVARAVAMALELPHLDTGAYYRAATVAVLRAGVEPTDEPSVVSVVARASLGYDRGRMTLDG
ncbi:MAG: (d)CMP kinase, partial [Acidimicrobiia bacterium]|nr:(d)CMP kinase [Acidimicrobiia bacterium]